MITRSKEHSSGVMRAKWDKENAMRMGQIRLEFAAKDGAAMKAALQSRVSPARVTE
jgi:tRNA threonylcarbamoyladenosine modification (KEOPS) complex  Pcc1 subunit